MEIPLRKENVVDPISNKKPHTKIQREDLAKQEQLTDRSPTRQPLLHCTRRQDAQQQEEKKLKLRKAWKARNNSFFLLWGIMAKQRQRPVTREGKRAVPSQLAPGTGNTESHPRNTEQVIPTQTSSLPNQTQLF